jgi:hypothetical protein
MRTDKLRYATGPLPRDMRQFWQRCNRRTIEQEQEQEQEQEHFQRLVSSQSHVMKMLEAARSLQAIYRQSYCEAEELQRHNGLPLPLFLGF